VPLAYVALLVLVAAAVSAVPGEPAVPLPDDGVLRVATFNIHHGADRRNTYNLQRTIDAIAGLNADVVALQEVMRNHPAYSCDDQPARIASGLRRATGREWSYVYARAMTGTDRTCLATSRGTGPDEEGLAFFATERILASKAISLTEGRSGLLVQIASLPGVPLVTTHLVSGRQNGPARANELAALIPWAARFGPGVLLGDFNAAPDAPELGVAAARYRDAWAELVVRGVASEEMGPTFPAGRRGRRIDYVFYDPALDLELVSMDVLDTATGSLPDASDHRPIVATFRRAAPALFAD
jgi:endonuclease/exonuclease/phosphatase family metal-dependent hydrolase